MAFKSALLNFSSTSTMIFGKVARPLHLSFPHRCPKWISLRVSLINYHVDKWLIMLMSTANHTTAITRTGEGRNSSFLLLKLRVKCWATSTRHIQNLFFESLSPAHWLAWFVGAEKFKNTFSSPVRRSTFDIVLPEFCHSSPPECNRISVLIPPEVRWFLVLVSVLVFSNIIQPYSYFCSVRRLNICKYRSACTLFVRICWKNVKKIEFRSLLGLFMIIWNEFATNAKLICADTSITRYKQTIK